MSQSPSQKKRAKQAAIEAGIQPGVPNSPMPRRSIQPHANPEAINLPRFQAMQDASPTELENSFPFATPVLFTHPLQRRSETQPGPDSESIHWWEPSGGRNSALFHGYIIGYRSYSVGTSNPDSIYQAKSQFSVLLVSVSPHRNPVPVLPWHTFSSRAEWEECLPSSRS